MEQRPPVPLPRVYSLSPTSETQLNDSILPKPKPRLLIGYNNQAENFTVQTPVPKPRLSKKRKKSSTDDIVNSLDQETSQNKNESYFFVPKSFNTQVNCRFPGSAINNSTNLLCKILFI